jgi:hypothetical protein
MECVTNPKLPKRACLGSFSYYVTPSRCFERRVYRGIYARMYTFFLCDGRDGVTNNVLFR